MGAGLESRVKAFSIGDLTGGLAAVAMLLPQAMAFGVALLAPYGVAPASAALAGLLCAAALCIGSGVSGGTRGMISAPTGPTLVLAAGALAAVSASTGPGSALVSLFVLVVLTGIGQMIIGATGGGRLIKFIPYSVVVGFMTGSAILMLISQYDPLFEAGGPVSAGFWRLLPAITAIVTFIICFAVARLTVRVPSTISGLVLGTLFFHAVMVFAPFGIPESWVIGRLPSLGAVSIGIDAAALSGIPWGILIAAAAAASILASLDTLLTSVIADVSTGTRHNARRELIGQGFGHIVSGFFGGVLGAGTTGATVVSVSSNGRRFAALAASVVIVAVIALAGSLGTLLPVAVLAGIIIRVSVGMFERDILAWLKSRKARADAFIALIVTVVTVGYDLMIAVALGVAISVILYLRDQVKAPVVHRRFTWNELHSVCRRTRRQMAVLEAKAERIIICELGGDLFFATADRLYSEIAEELERPVHLILNLRRVRRVDLTGARILQQLAERLMDSGGEIVFCEVHKGIGIGRDVGKTIRKLYPEAGEINLRTFVNTDEALEYVEDAILEEAGIGVIDDDGGVHFPEMDIFRELDRELVKRLEGIVRFQNVDAGDFLFREGEDGEELYFVLRGEVDIRLETTSHHYKRLAKYKPGTVFGEVAFLDPGPRTADAIACAPSRFGILSSSRFAELEDSHPVAAIGLLKQLSRNQSEELRWSAQEIQRLGDW